MDSSPQQQMDRREAAEEILLSSETHVLLFDHDEKMISELHKQLELVNQRITLLEERLQEATEDYDFTRNQLYGSEIARCNATQSRIVSQRHLRLELHLSNECTQALQSLQRQHQQMMADMETMNTMNKMWQEEMERDKHVIDSMAKKISEYESAASRLPDLPGEPFHSSTQPIGADIKSTTPSSDITIIDETPQISSRYLETSPTGLSRSWQNLTWVDT